MSITTNTLNRLRAASGLIPLIEDGLKTSQMAPEKAAAMAAAMAAFCQWAIQGAEDDAPKAAKLIESIHQGLERIQKQLSTVSVAD